MYLVTHRRWVLALSALVAGALVALASAATMRSRAGFSSTGSGGSVAQPVQRIKSAGPGGGRSVTGTVPAAKAIATAPSFPGWSIAARPLTVAGRARSYLVARPTDPGTGSLAVLVVLHGRGMTPVSMLRTSGFLTAVNRAVVVFPAGLGQSWNAGACCGTAHSLGVDDVGFVAAVVRDVLGTQPSTSAHAVFLVGYSNGGRMAYRVACQRPDLFAAVAAVEAVPVSTCAHPTPVAMLTVAASGDPLLTIDRGRPKVVDGYTEPTVAEVVAQWRLTDGCPTTALVSTAGALSASRWTGCAGGTEVGLDLYETSGHGWPSGGPATPRPQVEIWSFFRTHAPLS